MTHLATWYDQKGRMCGCCNSEEACGGSFEVEETQAELVGLH